MEVPIDLKTEEQWRDAYRVFRQLKPDLTLENYLLRRQGWLGSGGAMLGVRHDQTIVTVALIFVTPSIVRGSELVLQGLVTLSEFRSRGYGSALFQHVEILGRLHGCDRLVLHSGFEREEAHSFYESKCGMERRGYAFVKSLKGLDDRRVDFGR